MTQESEIEPGSTIEFTDEETGQQAILVHLESGDFAAYSAICTHRQCTLGYSDGNLACPCHGSVRRHGTPSGFELGLPCCFVFPTFTFHGFADSRFTGSFY